jgi:hypothetical protein
VPSKSKQFEWKDRDTAARDLLQVAYYAPKFVRMRALLLLRAFRSPAILDDLVEIVIDGQRDIWDRRYAIEAIASIPDDLSLPQFASYLAVSGGLDFDDLIHLVSTHQRNLDWFFQCLERLDPQAQLQQLCRLTNYWHAEALNPILCQRIIRILDIHPDLFDINVLDTLYFREGSNGTILWLRDRWDKVIELCLSSDINHAFLLLEEWDELREAIFVKTPPFVETYDQKKAESELLRARFRLRPVNYQASPVWQELHGYFQAASEGSKDDYGKLTRIVRHERINLCKRAVAVYLMGKLKQKYDVRPPLFHALLYGPYDANFEHLDLNAAIRLEAGEALRDIVTPDVWVTMVDAFFMRPRNVLEDYMSDWIEYLTDRLSGIEKPYSGMSLGDEDRRFWFRALVDSSSRDAET